MSEVKTSRYGPETQRFLAWLAEQQRTLGAVDVKFCLGDLVGATVEEVFYDLNRMLEAEDDPNPRVFADL